MPGSPKKAFQSSLPHIEHMPENRFFYPSPFNVDQTISFDKEEAHHMVNVMRCKENERVELVNGQGQLAVGRLLKATKKSVEAHIEEVFTELPKNFELIIAQAIPRFTRLDIILEKGTELGMTELWLFPGELSEKTLFSPHQITRMENILIAALKQCGRLYLPKIKILPLISAWKAQPFPIYFGDLREKSKPLMKQWQEQPPTGGAIFVIGPEKGLSDQEILHLEKLEGKGVTLHQNTLRTDTAPLTALSLMSHFLLCRASSSS